MKVYAPEAKVQAAIHSAQGFCHRGLNRRVVCVCLCVHGKLRTAAFRCRVYLRLHNGQQFWIKRLRATFVNACACAEFVVFCVRVRT